MRRECYEVWTQWLKHGRLKSLANITNRTPSLRISLTKNDVTKNLRVVALSVCATCACVCRFAPYNWTVGNIFRGPVSSNSLGQGEGSATCLGKPYSRSTGG